MENEEQVVARHKKEIKALEGEKRATLKKIKGTKGKKGKELQAATETEFDTKLKDLQNKHHEELQALQQSPQTQQNNDNNNDKEDGTATNQGEEKSSTKPALSEKERKLEKARKKREQKLRKERQKEQDRQNERAQDGPDLRDLEMNQIQDQNSFQNQNLQIQEIAADGHCLYRSIAAQMWGNNNAYTEIRHLCAQGLLEHRHELEPFCELNNPPPVETYEQYVENVKTSSDWGGHLELRALQLKLQIPMIVYRGMGLEPLVLGTLPDEEEENVVEEETESSPHLPPKIIRLSYHMHYYALGEHYNQVIVVKPPSPTPED